MLFIISFAAAVISAMGLGGGGILILYLTAFTDTPVLKAQGINLAFFLPIAIIAIIVHLKNGLIDKKRLPMLIAGGVLGVFPGFFAANYISDSVLSKLFAVVLLILGVRELFRRRSN